MRISLLSKVDVLNPLNNKYKHIIDENGKFVDTNNQSIDSILENVSFLKEGGISSIFDWGTKAITILFICGAILMITSIIFKNGQWQKWGQTTMLWSFISMIGIRAIPMIVLSIQSGMDVDEGFIMLVTALSQIAIFMGVLGVMLSILFKFAFKLIDHPEYHRWHKNVLNVSILMMVVSAVVPFLFSIM